MRKTKPKIFTTMCILATVTMLMYSRYIFVAEASPPQPTLGSATVDGNYDEWDTTNDFFANMYRAGKNDEHHPVESKLYLRYNCSTKTLYALVLGVTNVPVINSQGDNFTKIENTSSHSPLNIKLVDGSSGNNGAPPDFAWINLVNGSATGWEASAILDPGTYTALNVHAQVYDDGGAQTSAEQ